MFDAFDIQKEIIEKINYDAARQSNMQITKNILSVWRDSETISDMNAAREYYLLKNVGIKTKQRGYVDANGRRATNNTLSNARIASGFLRNSILQKINYGFSRPFVFEISGKDDTESKDFELYREEWKTFLNDKTRAIIKRIATNAVIYGLGWGFPSLEEGKLELVSVEPSTIYPAWNDSEHNYLDVIVHDYKQVIFGEDERREVVTKVEYWDQTVAEYYIESEDILKPDVATEMSLINHDSYNAEKGIGHIEIDGTRIGWGRVPYIPLKANDDELPLLNVVRAHIDAYDELTSKAVDTLVDDMDAVLLLKGVSPEMGSLIETREKIKNSNIASVDVGGGAEYLKNNPDITAVRQQLEALAKDIKQFSSTVDVQDVRFGTNNSGEALKMMYQELDIYLNGLETYFRDFMEKLKYFFDRSLELCGKGTMDKWADYGITVTLDRDMMVNTSQLIEDTLKLRGLVSQETLDAYNPAVIDHVIEQARRDEEQTKYEDEQNKFR